MIIKTDRNAAISKLGLGDLLIVNDTKVFALSQKENRDFILVSLTKEEENLEDSTRNGLIQLILSTFDDDFKIVKYDNYQMEGTSDNRQLEMKDIVRDQHNKYFIVDVVDGQYCLLSFSYDLGDKQRFPQSSLEDLNKHFDERTDWFGLEKLNRDDINVTLCS